NSHKEFLTSSFGPVIMNVGWIAGIILITTYGPRDLVLQLRWQSLVTVASGIGQVFFQVPALKRIGFHFRWSWNPHHPGIQKCKKLIMPVLIGFSVMQINLVVDSAFAYWAGPGANSALWYGNRLMQFPLGVFAIAISSALLPTISQQFAAGRPDIAKKNLSFSMRAVCLIVLPCAAGLIVLATPIVRFLFERGQFDAESTRRTAAVLWCYSVGLLGYAGQKVIISGFYALQNTRTPMKVSIAALLVNVFFNATLLRPMGEAGLAMATSISGIFNFVALIVIFHRRVSPLPIKEIMTSFLRILMATAAMAVTAVFCYHILAGRLPGVSASVQALRVFGAITLATLSYPVYCFLFRVPELQEALAFFGNRKKTA
ncbi:MAG TPA: murein biosynthesis integral membrane protein MurJ, partial [Verrucomicrobiae bacterium]|nr:murein biosynthesis integral membrane protein MurJ [Verrucomicrobiae bacterium]